jgi:hypothetical protein
MGKYKRLDYENFMQHITILSIKKYNDNLLSRLKKESLINDEELSKIQRDLTREINTTVYTDLIHINKYIKEAKKEISKKDNENSKKDKENTKKDNEIKEVTINKDV